MSVQDRDLNQENTEPPVATPPEETGTGEDRDAVPELTAEQALEAADAPPEPAGIGELIFSLLLAAVGVAIVVIGELTIKDGSAAGDLLGPRAFPRIAGALLAICAGAAAISSARTRLAGRPVVVDGAVADEPGIPASAVLAITIMVFTGIYLATFSFLGYLLATPIYLAASLWMLKVRRPLPILIVSLGMPILLYYVFAQLLGVLLPAGLLRPVLVPIGWAL